MNVKSEAGGISLISRHGSIWSCKMQSEDVLLIQAGGTGGQSVFHRMHELEAVDEAEMLE